MTVTRLRPTLERGDVRRADLPVMPPMILAADVEEGEPPFLLEGVLYVGILLMLYAPSNSFKSFVALTLGCSVATGERFAGRAVQRGPVVYVCAEGSARLLRRRAQAWCEAHGHDLADLPLYFIPQAVPLSNAAAVAGLRARLDAVAQELDEPVALVIVDTLTASAGGANQNTDEMQGPINALREIAAATGATVAVVHHTNKGKEDDRGWSGIRDAMDTIWKVAKDGAVVTVECSKQRDLPQHLPFVFQVLSPIAGSCALKAATEGVAVSLAESERELLDVLTHCHGLETRTPSEWRQAAGLSHGTFYRAKNRLLTFGYVQWSGTEARPRYSLTDKGWRVYRALTANAANGLPAANWQAGEILPSTLPLLEAGGMAVTHDSAGAEGNTSGEEREESDYL